VHVIFDPVPPATCEFTLTVMSVNGALVNVYSLPPLGQDALVSTTRLD
jgi:hypothetical protein